MSSPSSIGFHTGSEVKARELAWDGCLNVRDLGGFPTEDGGETGFGAVIRADSVRQLTEAGWDALLAHGVGRIVDLRWEEELAEDEPREPAIEVVHVPVLPGLGDAAWAALPRDDRTAEYLALLECGRARFARAVAALARASERPVVVHCAAGRDRTGLVSALVLRLAGVGVATIAADYELSDGNLEPLRRPWIEGAADEAERARRTYLWTLPDMRRVLDELEHRYGSAARYLASGGLSRDDLARVRARLRA